MLRYMNIKDAAGYIGMSVSGLRRRCHEGTIPCIKDHGSWRFDRVEIDKHMDRLTVVKGDVNGEPQSDGDEALASVFHIN